MEIKLTFLGTSDAIPSAKRSHPAILLSWNNELILFDCGEGTQRQFRISHTNPCKLTRIFLTHLHADHSLGLPGLIKTLEMMSYAKKLEIYGPQGIKEHIFLLQKLYGRFNLKYEIHEIYNTRKKALETSDIEILASQMEHTSRTLAYSFILKEKTRINKKALIKAKVQNSPLLKQLSQGKDITINGKKLSAKKFTYRQKGKKVSFILDTRLNRNIGELAKDSDLIVCEATYSSDEEQLAREHYHLTAGQAAAVAKKARAKTLALVHISQRHEHNLKKIESEAKKVFKNTTIAKDFDTLKV